MAVTSDYAPVREEGNGSKVAFDFAFKIFNASDLVVSKLVRATDVATLQVLTTNYTVRINTDTDGGTVTYKVAPTALQDSFIQRVMDITQEADIPSNNLFREVQIENALDKATMVDQQLQEQLDRSLQLPDTSLTTGLKLPEPEALKVLGWNAAADALENKDAIDADMLADTIDARDDAIAAQVTASAAQVTASAAAVAAAASAASIPAKASQAEAEAGTADDKYMTPLKTAQAIAKMCMPVGIVVTLGVSTNPATLFGFGTWAAIAGKVIVGINAGDTEFDTLDETGGVKEVTLTAAQSGLPAHTHLMGGGYGTYDGDAGGGLSNKVANTATAANSTAAASEAHNNLQPYIVKYVWQRTA